MCHDIRYPVEEQSATSSITSTPPQPLSVEGTPQTTPLRTTPTNTDGVNGSPSNVADSLDGSTTSTPDIPNSVDHNTTCTPEVPDSVDHNTTSISEVPDNVDCNTTSIPEVPGNVERNTTSTPEVPHSVDGNTTSTPEVPDSLHNTTPMLNAHSPDNATSPPYIPDTVGDTMSPQNVPDSVDHTTSLINIPDGLDDISTPNSPHSVENTTKSPSDADSNAYNTTPPKQATSVTRLVEADHVPSATNSASSVSISPDSSCKFGLSHSTLMYTHPMTKATMGREITVVSPPPVSRHPDAVLADAGWIGESTWKEVPSIPESHDTEPLAPDREENLDKPAHMEKISLSEDTFHAQSLRQEPTSRLALPTSVDEMHLCDLQGDSRMPGKESDDTPSHGSPHLLTDQDWSPGDDTVSMVGSKQCVEHLMLSKNSASPNNTWSNKDFPRVATSNPTFEDQKVHVECQESGSPVPGRSLMDAVMNISDTVGSNIRASCEVPTRGRGRAIRGGSSTSSSATVTPVSSPSSLVAMKSNNPGTNVQNEHNMSSPSK